MLVILEPETFIAVIVGKIICSVAVLLSLEPFSFVLFTVREEIDAHTLAFAFDVLASVGVSIGKGGSAHAVGFTLYQFSLILASVRIRIGTYLNLLRPSREVQHEG